MPKKIAKLRNVALSNFTVFRDVEVDFGPGVNIFIGKNGTGKTHLLKLLYAACEATKPGTNFSGKLERVFLPYEGHLGRLVHRRRGSTEASVSVAVGASRSISLRVSSHTKDPCNPPAARTLSRGTLGLECVYIPVKEMLAHAPGFRALYATRNIHFEETYADIVDRAYLPLLRGPVDRTRASLLKHIEKNLDGKVEVDGETFFLNSRKGKLEFTLVAEGMRKLALLWLLIQNGTLPKGSVLFWDEPETNLNPAMLGEVVEVLLGLQRLGVQVFLATHDYVLLKEFDLRTSKKDDVRYHACFADQKTGDMQVDSTESYLDIHPNAIAETFLHLYDRDVARALSGKND